MSKAFRPPHPRSTQIIRTNIVLHVKAFPCKEFHSSKSSPDYFFAHKYHGWFSKADFRTYSDPHVTYTTDKSVGVLDVTPVLSPLHSHGVTTAGSTVLTHAFNAKVLYGHLKMFGSSSFR